MKIGLFAISYGTCADPEAAVRVARHAEAAGFESVWTGERGGTPLFRWTGSCANIDTVAQQILGSQHR